MIVTEYYKARKDGVVLMRTWSDCGMMIQRNGALYSEAIDPENEGRIYTETETPVVAEVELGG